MVRIPGCLALVGVSIELAIGDLFIANLIIRAKLLTILIRCCCSDLDKLRNNSKNWISYFCKIFAKYLQNICKIEIENTYFSPGTKGWLRIFSGVLTRFFMLHHA